MPSWVAAYGGSGGSSFRLVVEVDLLAQEIDNNRSLIQYRCYMTRVVGGSRYYSLPPYYTYGNTNINGYNPGRTITFDFNPGVGQRVYLTNNENYWIGHDANGNANPYFGANHNANLSPYLLSAATGGNWQLPNIPRYANITGFSVTNVTDVGFNINVNVDNLCDLLQYTINGGASWNQVYGDFYSRTVSLTDLPSGTTYPVIVWVRRKDSQLASQSGVIYVATLEQSKFLGFF